MEEMNKAKIADILGLIEHEEPHHYSDESIIKIYCKYNIEWHIKRSRLYIKQYTKHFKQLFGGLARIPFLTEIVRIEDPEGEMKIRVFNQQLLNEVHLLVKEYYINKKTQS